MLKPVIIAAIILVGVGTIYFSWGKITPHLDGFLTDGPNTRVENAVDDRMADIARSMRIPSGKAAVIFCAPHQVRNHNNLYEVFYHPDFKSNLEERYQANHPRGAPSRFNIISFGSYAQVHNQVTLRQTLTRSVSGVDTEEYFTCPPSHFVFHRILTTYPLPLEKLEEQFRAEAKSQDRKTGRGGIWSIFGIGRPEAEVLFCKPYLFTDAADLDPVLENPDFKASLERGFQDQFPDGTYDLYTVVFINRDVEIAEQTLRGEPLHLEALTFAEKNFFKCPPTHRQYHYMKHEYLDPPER